MAPGGKVYFKTRINYGQGAIFAVDGLTLTDKVLNEVGTGTEYARVSSDVYAPDFSQMDSQRVGIAPQWRVVGEGATRGVHPPTTPEINQVPEVRYRNRWDSPKMGESLGFSMDGYYYYVLGLEEEDFLLGEPGKIDFSFQVSGEESGKPTSEFTTEPAKPTENPQVDSRIPGVPRWALVAAGGFLVILGVGGLLYLLIKRRS